MSGDAVVAVLDGGSDGPAEGQNEAPEKAMEPEARAFDPEVFLSLSGHTSVAGPPGEVNGGGSPVPVAGPEVVAAERNVSEPEVVQGNSGTGGGDFDDAGFGPVDEKSVPLPPADGGGSVGPGVMLATPRSSVQWSPMSLWPQRWSPGAVRQANVTTPFWRRRRRNCWGWWPRATAWAAWPQGFQVPAHRVAGRVQLMGNSPD